jgi:NADPH2:quinone reductase
MPQSMTAVFGGCGPDLQARQVPVPEPGPGQVLVHAHAVSINNADITMLASADDPTASPRKDHRAGYEFAGEIAAIGPVVDGVRVGDRVMGTAPESFAQFIIADHRHMFGIPEALDTKKPQPSPPGC